MINSDIFKRTISPKKYFLLFMIGLIVRLITSFGYGDGDMEHFKSWSVLTNKEGLIKMYSKSDADLLKYAKEKNVSIIQSFNSNRKYIKFKPEKKYWRNEYMIMYPPISEYFLFLSGKLQSIFYKNFENNRLFNFFINLPQVILSFLIFYALHIFLGRRITVDKNISIISLFYWLNPIFILDSPIQGYNNTLLFFLGLFTIYFFQSKKYTLVIILATLIFWTKPQGILILPLFCFIIFTISNCKLLAIKQTFFGFFLVSFIILVLPIIKGYGISYLLGSVSGIFSLDTWSLTLLSARSWNIWWLLSYFDSNLNKMEVSISSFNMIHSMKLNVISYLIFITLILHSLYLFIKIRNKNLDSILFLFLISFFYYNMFMLNVQYNQFIIIIPLILYFSILIPELFYHLLSIFVFYFLQIFYYGGLGRDIGTPAGLVNRLNLNYFFNLFFVISTILIYIIWFFSLKKIYEKIKTN